MNCKMKNRNIVYFIAVIALIGGLILWRNEIITTNRISSANISSIKNNKATFTNISPKEGKERLEKEKDIIILDVRTIEEYESGHLRNSILIPVDDLEREASTKLLDKDAKIFVICRSGRRSVTASNILVKQGYTNVYDLGGILDWPYEIVK